MIVVLADASITGERGIDCDIDGAGDVYIIKSCRDCYVGGRGTIFEWEGSTKMVSKYWYRDLK